MTGNDSSPAAVTYFLEPGYIFVATRPAVISSVLGSAVSVCLYDRKRKLGGMNQFQLPEVRDRKKATARYGNAATLALVRMMEENGCSIRTMEAQIIGGGYNRAVSDEDVGRTNVGVARRVLGRKGIRIVSEDVGGTKGRKVVFNTGANEVAVMKVDRLRAGDWYPYEGDR
ncbi:MAG: chemotaxis protein CheD [Desulfococcaceae bacterium]